MLKKILSGIADHREKRRFITLKRSYYMSLLEKIQKALSDLAAARREIARLQAALAAHAATETLTADQVQPLLDESAALAADAAITAPPAA